jgi:hypothetical protein
MEIANKRDCGSRDTKVVTLGTPEIPKFPENVLHAWAILISQPTSGGEIRKLRSGTVEQRWKGDLKIALSLSDSTP